MKLKKHIYAVSRFAVIVCNVETCNKVLLPIKVNYVDFTNV